MIVTLTDGKENASETPQDHLRELVDRHRDRGWGFLFIGANQDAALTAERMGMDADRSLDMQHSGEGARASYKSTSENIKQARRTGDTGGFDEEDRRRQGGSDSELHLLIQIFKYRIDNISIEPDPVLFGFQSRNTDLSIRGRRRDSVAVKPESRREMPSSIAGPFEKSTAVR